MIKVNKAHTWDKVGLNEVEGLKDVLHEVMAPLVKMIQNKAYWSTLELEEAEYRSRDGFIPHSHNCGGLVLDLIIPKSEEYNFSFLKFGDCYSPEECTYECHCYTEGCLDSHFKVWLKFEGIEEGELKFYLVASGGNQDAPYFRDKYQPVLFETEFQAKTLKDVKKQGVKAMKALMSFLNK